MSKIDYSKKPIFAMIHCSGAHVVDRALKEIEILKEEGVDGIIVENYHGDEMDVVNVLKAIERDIHQPENDILIGINILPNEYYRSIPLANTFGADFVQLDHVSGIYQNGRTLEYEGYKNCRHLYDDIEVMGGVWPKYYNPKTGSDLVEDIKVGMSRCDAVVVTGQGTGIQTDIDKIQQFRDIIDENGGHPLVVGAGLNPSNVAEQLFIADGGIVGSCLKPYNRTQEMINRDLVREFMDEVAKAR